MGAGDRPPSRLLLALLGSLGCATGATDTGIIPGDGPDADTTHAPDGATPDAAAGVDAPPAPDPDASQQAAAIADHLLLTEVVLTPVGAEYLEIANLTGNTVDLSGYFLSDTAEYMFTPGMAGAGPAPSVITSDFIAAFPPGATLADGQVAVIAIDGDGFELSYGSTADYCLSGASCENMTATAVGSNPTLTNAGEPIILFHWDSASDLVSDIDIVKAGVPSASNPMPNKSGVSVDGPDEASAATSYSAEAGSITGPSDSPGDGLSLKRVLPESGAEVVGGNGRDGHDETSEDGASTWDDAGSYTAPTPGLIPPSLSNP